MFYYHLEVLGEIMLPRQGGGILSYQVLVQSFFSQSNRVRRSSGFSYGKVTVIMPEVAVHLNDHRYIPVIFQNIKSKG